MNCEKFNEMLNEYDCLSEADMAEMKKHADECDNCRSELDFMLAITEAAKSLPKIEPPADFMDKLNERIDAEEKKKQRISRRVAHNVRSNWKQYATAAACFALVAVVTSNSKVLIDRMNASDDGVISEETVVSDDSAESTAGVLSGESADISNSGVGDVQTASDESTVVSGLASDAAVNNAESPAAEKISASINTPSVISAAVTAATAAPQNKTEATGVALAVKTDTAAAAPKADVEEESKAVSVQPEAVSEINVQDTIADTQDTQSADGYTLTSPSVGADAAYAMAREARSTDEESETTAVVHNVEEEYSLVSEKGIAMGRYYRHDKDGNPITDEEQPKAIGNIKISSQDADRAMNVILQYTHDVKDELYSTDSANLTLMLSDLIKEGVDYTNYIPSYEGEIKFKIVIGG